MVKTKRNLIINILLFISNVLITILIVPYLIEHVGLRLYGIIAVTLTLSQYSLLVSQSITSSVNRFLTISISKKNTRKSEEIYSTALSIIVGLIAFQLFTIFTFGHEISDFITEVPEIKKEAFLLFALTMFALSVSMFKSVVVVPIYSINRLDVIQGVEIGRLLLRVILILLFFMSFEISIVYVGLATLISELVALAFLNCLKNTITDKIKFSIFSIKISRVKELSSYSGWMLVNQVGFLLFMRVDVLFINQYLGNESVGEYNAITQIANVSRTVVGVLAGVVSPVIIARYANNKLDSVNNIANESVSILSVMASIGVAYLIAFSDSIIYFWLGERFLHLSTLLIVSILPYFLTLGALPYFSVFQAYGNVKVPALMSCLFGLLIIILNWLFNDIGYYNLIYVSSITGAVLLMKNAIFMPAYAHKIMSLPLSSMLIRQFKIVGYFCVFLVMAYTSNAILNEYDHKQFIMATLSYFAVSLIIFNKIYSYRDLNRLLKDMG
ncbi:oligosaccharide flippase family protein [Vibrio astriarenae]